MASFATPQRPARTLSHRTAAPIAVEETSHAAMLPDAKSTAAERPAREMNNGAAHRPLIPIPLFRPDARASAGPTPHLKQSPAPTQASTDASRVETRDTSGMAHDAAPEAVRVVVQARMTAKQTGFGATGAAPGAGGTSPIQRKNDTGLPDALKESAEALSGIRLDDVRVRYNSPKAAEIGALAYAQGTEIHLGLGQERHLPHEAWHTVQQKQGRVKPTMALRGAAINDNAGLEHEANVMGAKAIQAKAMPGGPVIQRAYVGADAKEDVALFPKETATDEQIDLSKSASAGKAATLGITGINLKHYLNRHTFKYQPLSGSSTYAPLTGMFPIATDKDAVKSMVVEAIGLVPAGIPVTADIESVLVDLASGLRVNLGALSGGKLQAFFPQSGTGFHSYTGAELQAIKVEKDALEKPAKDAATKALKDKQDEKAKAQKEKNDQFAAYKAAQAAKAIPATVIT